MRIRAIQNLLKVTSGEKVSTRPMEAQVDRIRERLIAGVGLSGQSFAAFKNKQKAESRRPLDGAESLYNEVHYEVDRGITGFMIKATVYGRAAKIIQYQSSLRPFNGFNEADRRLAVQDVVGDLERFGRVD